MLMGIVKKVFTSMITVFVVVVLFFTAALVVAVSNDHRDARRVAAVNRKQVEEKAATLARIAAAQAKSLLVVCQDDQKNWNTWQRVIDATENPPSLAGKRIDPVQRRALRDYGEHLRKSVGKQPKPCPSTPVGHP